MPSKGGPVWGVYQIAGQTADPNTDRLLKTWEWPLQEIATEYCKRWNRQRQEHGERFYVNVVWPTGPQQLAEEE